MNAILHDNVNLFPSTYDHATAVREHNARLERDRKAAEQHKAKEHAERLALARAALVKTLDRLLTVADAKSLAERGDIDKAFAEWKARKPKAYSIAAMSALEGAIDGVKYLGAVMVDDRKVTLPDAVIDEAGETLRHELLAAVEAITARI
jgi:hypothetical protein